MPVDGVLGPHTIQNLQLFLNKENQLGSLAMKYLYKLNPLVPDGRFGKRTKMELQVPREFLNPTTRARQRCVDFDRFRGKRFSRTISSSARPTPLDIDPILIRRDMRAATLCVRVGGRRRNAAV